ncbi:hypothetical protein FLK61_40225 [Paenalkalicoccus suaedae]|uniref:Uncharacterized protein n=1 Tax=Paenalkalicoccus suaedae TaxID=2592382 RepID=A0A859FI56_9BACI|nr:hypothetical protein FLK61_40225 [Paenalkalicoccus suaedae]
MTLTSMVGEFASPNVGTNISVTPSLTLGGIATTEATIDENSLSLSGIIGSEDVELNPVPSFGSNSVGVNKNVELTNSSL